MSQNQNVLDVTIIGGGTIGLFAAFYCGMRGLSTKVLEGSSFLGGKVAQFYPEKNIYDIGGIPAITGADLVQQLIEQANLNQPEILLEQYVESIHKVDNDVFELTTRGGDVHFSKTILLTTGFGIYDPIPLEHKDAEKYAGTTIHYMMGNPDRFRDKQVAVLSNQRAGVDWALTLAKTAKHVFLFCKGTEFQYAADVDLEKLHQATNIEVRYNVSIEELKGDGSSLHELQILSDKEESSYSVDELLVYQGVKMVSAPFSEWNLQAEKGRLVVDQNMATSVPGIYAAGDGIQYENKSMIIATGFSEVTTAVNSMAKYLNPKAVAQVYSTVEYRYKK
ncbi:NAD(P)/FAD-dependent oxidoreductase [Radiobacillus deserti]|uniref:Ferredoxin--NADP reductase n=1 Tax=Radiobacillus deserti TaxID=2594883 RepID=A0A516KEY8_9BACI|nr:NAD(P)/FAD-dependent oxidoreductase [Radiobacillus deserti]QDP39971.1 NAD(P)/FAD-dependent oxidoreductase [Radiobacillus deserti]